MIRKPIAPFTLALFALVTTARAGDNLVMNGGFEAVSGSLPKGWVAQEKDRIEIAQEGSNHSSLKVEPVLGAVATTRAGPAAPPSNAPTLKLQDVGIELNPEVVQKMQQGRTKPESKPLTLLSVGPGCPGLAAAPKARVVKFPGHWTKLDTPKELGGVTAGPDTLLVKLPEVLAELKPEIVLMWGDVDAKRKAGRGEREDWQDVIAICLRMGCLPVMVLPNGDVKFSGGGGDVGLISQPKKTEPTEEEKAAWGDLEVLRRTMISVGGSLRVPMVEQAPFATTSDRLDKILSLVEKHILGRTPPKREAPVTPKPGTEEEEE